jgi:hypothetical protein
MRDRLIIGVCVAAFGWPNGALAQQPVTQAIEILPLWAQLALSSGPTAGAVFAAVGLLRNFYQSRRTRAQARATLVAECLKTFAEDTDIQHAYNTIVHPEFQYQGFDSPEYEQQIARLLRHFSNIALAWQVGLLSIQDIRPIEYYILRVVRNPEIKKYIDFVARWSKEQKLGQNPFIVLNALTDRLEADGATSKRRSYSAPRPATPLQVLGRALHQMGSLVITVIRVLRCPG